MKDRSALYSLNRNRGHGVPATLTTTGRVVRSWLPGHADSLRGPARWLEIWHRLRRQHDRRHAARLLYATWRHGVTLSGPSMRWRGGQP